MTYQVLAEDETPLDAHFNVNGNTIVFHSGGRGTKGKNAPNVHYTRGLRLLIQRLAEAGHRVQRAWVDGSRVQAIPIAERVILDDRDAAASSAEQVSRMVSRMTSRTQAIGRDTTLRSNHGNFCGRIRLQLADVLPDGILPIIKSIPVTRDFRSEERLPVSELERVTAEHLFVAAQRLLEGYTAHGFGDSTDYDVLLEDGSRLAPKQLFGMAATHALGFQVEPRHFVGGLGSPCFRLMASAAYRIVPKGEATTIQLEPAEPTDREWSEGTPRLRQHMRRERAPGLRQAKLAEFRRLHGGRLSCERCTEDLVLKYHTVDAEACIDVHHRLPVSEMQQGHRTQLQDLQCLCANCHRLVHHEMRKAEAAMSTAQCA